MTAFVAVTGASGYVGRALINSLNERGVRVRALVRSPSATVAREERFPIGDIGQVVDWTAALTGADTVVHLASVVHNEGADGAQYHNVNVLGTRRLAEAAVRCGIKRIVFVSTIGVNGSSSTDRPFSASDAPAPVGPYAQSKLDAERELTGICSTGGVEWTIARPPMIYGRDAPGNFQRLVRLVGTGLPLPLASANARRSLIGIENLVSALQVLMAHRAAANRTFLVRDNEQESVAELVRLVAQASGRRARLFPVPVSVIATGLKTIGHGADVTRLLSPLLIDMTPLTEELGWSPPLKLSEGIRSALGLQPRLG